MLPPNELKRKNFTRTLRGYNSVEVDDYIDFLVKKYSEVYRKNEELERNIKIITAKLQEISENEEYIKTAYEAAKKQENEIVSDATEQAEIITRAAKQNCDRILADFKVKIRDERIALHKLREQVKQFKERIFEAYQIHIEYLEQLSPTIDKEIEWEMDEGDYVTQVLDQMKLDIIQENREKEFPEQRAEKKKEFLVKNDVIENDDGSTKTFTAIKNNDIAETISFDFSKDSKLVIDNDAKSNTKANLFIGNGMEATIVLDRQK